jgi:uncharacterized membrane protein YcaP (DUF421 family)
MFFDSANALLRTVIIGGSAYAALVLLLRISGKRTLAKWNAFDLVITVAFGSTLATALLSKDTTLVQGVLAFGLLIALQWVITASSVRSQTFERWVKARPRLLLWHGQIQQAALREERVTPSELRAAVRGRGIAALEDVEAVVPETDGSFSVIEPGGSAGSALADVAGYPHASPPS